MTANSHRSSAIETNEQQPTSGHRLQHSGFHYCRKCDWFRYFHEGGYHGGRVGITCLADCCLDPCRHHIISGCTDLFRDWCNDSEDRWIICLLPLYVWRFYCLSLWMGGIYCNQYGFCCSYCLCMCSLLR